MNSSLQQSFSKENYDILNDELQKNYNMEITDMGKTSKKKKIECHVRVMPPPVSSW